jgi:hypothetical protein
MVDWKTKSWAYDIETYERCKSIVQKIDECNNLSFNRQFWIDRANRIVAKYPNVRLEPL